MSVTTAIIVNAILDLTALGTLGYVCLSPFRASAERAVTSTPSRLPERRGKRVAA